MGWKDRDGLFKLQSTLIWASFLVTIWIVNITPEISRQCNNQIEIKILGRREEAWDEAAEELRYKDGSLHDVGKTQSIRRNGI